MNGPAASLPTLESAHWPVLLDNIPILYEDEENEDMGDANLHTLSIEILHLGINVHVADHHPDLQVYANLNCYYKEGPPHARTGSKPYVSPDIMVVRPFKLLPVNLRSYTIGKEGPAPQSALESLSEGTAEVIDLDLKLVIYAKLGIQEYILVDATGDFLPERLLLKRLQADRTWKDEQDPDGGVTSFLGFRLIWEPDGQVRVVDAATNRGYLRPWEGEREAQARILAEQDRQETQQSLRAEADAHKKTEQLLRAEADARQKAQQLLRAEADARQKTQQLLRAEADAHQKTEQLLRAEADAHQKTEQLLRAEADARQKTEERLRVLEAELARLGEKKPEQN